MCNKQACSHGKYEETGSFSLPTKQTSMCTLIVWNISKAVEKNPSIDLTRAVHLASERLEQESRDESRVISQTSEERHLTCALLAWHQLGHTDIDGLCKFIEENRNKQATSTPENSSNIQHVKTASDCAKTIKTDQKRSKNIKDVESRTFDTKSVMGPVVKLPVESIVMRYTEPPPCQHHLKKATTQPGVQRKIDAACCMDTACVQRLTELDKMVNELRTRATRLARREAERVAVLERAEAAWVELERGYQRRLSLAIENEDDMNKQIKKTIEERNAYKTICTSLAGTLKERGDAAEKEVDRLRSLEKEVYDRACVRQRLSEESAKGDAELAEQLCRTSQLDRDLQFKEEHARRKVASMRSELESSQCLSCEAERAMRFELSTLKAQITEVSKKLLAEEDKKNSIKIELVKYRQEKADIIEDLDGCKDMCDSRMKAKVDELNLKKEQLNELKEKVLECQCKLPLDVGVEVKRTPSLAALCHCTPEDKVLDSCSCISLRSQLLSNLLADLFGGLQAELTSSGLLMPCSMLLCIDDRHNWDRSSAVKSSLRSFFAQLLVAELDIAIATSIEKYHVKWVGKTCADVARLKPDPEDDENEGWEQRAIERRAHTLATKIAEQLFEERAEQLKQKAKEIVTSGPPPCECKTNQRTPAVFRCLVKPPTTNTAFKNSEVAPSYMRRTMQDVTQLKHQLHDLKKEAIKKEDLRHMEEKLNKIIGRVSKVESPTTSKSTKCVKSNQEQNYNEKLKTYDYRNNKDTINSVGLKKLDKSILKKYIKRSSNLHLGRIDKKSNNVFKKLDQSFAVNLCLCSGQEAPNELSQAIQRNINLKPSWKQKKSKDLISNVTSVKQSKPISTLVMKEKNNKLSTKSTCPTECTCFHKIPSNTSIDKLLEKLSKWNSSFNLKEAETKCLENKNTIENIKNKTLISDLVNLVNSEAVNDETLNLKGDNTQLNKHNYNKDTASKNILAYTTESEYIGAINLEKSNYNICKCPKNGKIKCSDTTFRCINDDICECRSFGLSKISQTSEFNILSDISKISQVYLAETDNPRFKCISTDTKSLIKNDGKKGEISENTFIHDLVKKSQLFPNVCDYSVKFLGVTLTNTNSSNRSKKNYDDSMLRTSIKEPSNQDLNMDVIENKSNNSINSKSFVKKDFNCDYATKNNDVLGELLVNEDNCVCCKNNEISNDLELNTFNLLGKHIKEKLGEYLSSTDKSGISTDEKNQIYSTILIKVKEIISESTKGLSCNYCKESVNDGNWSRAYGMLKEYLKVKIKRVQCSCVSSEGNVKSILENVCDLIEHDFQRLKQKCKCKNDDENGQKSNSVPLAKDSINETTVGNKTERDIKNYEHILFQLASYMHLDKSCDVLDNVKTSIKTCEKKVSCEFKMFGTDCCCKYNNTEISDSEKKPIVNHCINITSKNNGILKDPLNKSKLNCSISSSLPTKENISKLDLPANIPYIGCTLSSKSLLQNNTNKIGCIWKTVTDKTSLRKCSYIMRNVLTKKDSENYKSNLHAVNSQTKNMSAIEVNTLNNDENIVLKYYTDSSYNINKNIKTFDEIDTSTENDNDTDNSSPNRECETRQFTNDNGYQTDPNDKTYLYDSLHLPTATETFPNSVESKTVDIDNSSHLQQETCVCKMVPICHVKMLVNNIEKKLIQTKCTCDSSNTAHCSVHS